MITATYLSTEEAGQIIGESRRNIARRCKAQQIPAKRIGKEWRINSADLEEFMKPGSPAPSPRDRAAARRRRKAADGS